MLNIASTPIRCPGRLATLCTAERGIVYNATDPGCITEPSAKMSRAAWVCAAASI